MTRRRAVMLGLGLPAGVLGLPRWAFADREFWNGEKASDWTEAEIKQMLTQSPWAKAASISDAGQSGPLSSPRMGGGGGGGRRGMGGGGAGGRNGSSVVATGNQVPAGGPSSWKATVRWQSALPVREALKTPASKDVADYYILAMVGDLPSAGVPSNDDDPAERKQKLEALQDTTRLDKKDEPINLSRAEATSQGNLFYFARVFTIKPEDKQVTFVTKIGALEVKCKFVLRDMMYRGNLEL